MSPQALAMTPARRARLQLSLLAEPGDPRLQELLHTDDASRVVAAAEERTTTTLDVPEPWRRRATRLGEATEAAVSRARAAGMRWLVPGDPEWPERLADLALTSVISGARGEPLGLWVRGRHHLGELVERSVAVVGARDATTYGCDVATDLSADLADAGVTVISGAAYGIDSAAHRGALAMRRPTIAVLACGADVDYPRAHAGLLARIVETGLVVSEQPPGATPTKGRFLTRNRIIAALPVGTVVVEAGRRSGALNTANWAAETGRVVMGVAGPVTSQASVGVHQSIRSGQSILVTNGREVLEAIDPVGRHDARVPSTAATALDLMPSGMRLVLEAVPARSVEGSAGVAAAVGCSTEAAEVVLERLRADGWVESVEGSWRLARRADLSAGAPPRTVTR